jgi:hypothetical protein
LISDEEQLRIRNEDLMGQEFTTDEDILKILGK